ncbi:MAG: heavy-metal-associated domain-containing protein [Halobacteriaceae archaeon]
MERKRITVTGMSCTGCEQNVENALQTINGVSRVDADHEENTVEVVIEDSVADADIDTAIKDAGYDVAT